MAFGSLSALRAVEPVAVHLEVAKLRLHLPPLLISRRQLDIEQPIRTKVPRARPVPAVRAGPKVSYSSGGLIQPKRIRQQAPSFILWRRYRRYETTPSKRQFCGKKAWRGN
jgi:hypothetical protein